jgi:glucose/arabinose dehydrogenase
MIFKNRYLFPANLITMSIKQLIPAILLLPAISLFAQQDTLSAAYKSNSVKNFSKVIGWNTGEMPKAPEGFTVNKFADGLDNPRKIYVLPNGDILIAEAATIKTEAMKIGADIVGAGKSENKHPSVNRITLLRDTNGDGVAEVHETYIDELKQPFGMLLLGDKLYIANTDALLRYDYKPGETKMTSRPEKIMDLQAGKHNRHWTRNLIASQDGEKILIGVGSGTNVGEDGMTNEIMRANILEINKDGSGLKVYASGTRNPVGLAWAPGTNTLWAAVNERDELGDHLVPDYFTSIKQGGFYGWPYSYWGQHVDNRVKGGPRPDLVAKAIVPDISLGNHVAPLGMIFYTHNQFPSRYHDGAFIAEHGSWNSSVLQGYKVVFIPFNNGKPTGKPEDFLTGFIADLDKNKVHGRPVDIAMLADGSILVSDDVSNTIWRIKANK